MRTLITEREIILHRDTLPLSELKRQTTECKEKFGFVDYKHIFITMGYVHAFNDKWYLCEHENVQVIDTDDCVRGQIEIVQCSDCGKTFLNIIR